MNKKTKELLKVLEDYFPIEWKELLDDPEKTKMTISKIARELPPQIYEVVREKLVSEIFSIDNSTSTRLYFVVDSNIIVSDAFRVGKGKYSSTDRIFSSPFVKLYAPKSIRKEVFIQIEKDLPKDCSLVLANNRAQELLSKIELIDDSKLKVECIELSKFKDKYNNDASFLKVAIGLGIKNVITRDKDFDGQTHIERFDLGNAVKMIVSIESGALSISIVGGVTFIGGKAIYLILLLLYKVFTEIFALIAMTLSAGIAGLVKAVINAPDWLLAIIGGALIGIGIAFACSKNLRQQGMENITKVYDWLTDKSEFLLQIMTNLLNGAVDISAILKDDYGAYFVNAGLALTASIAEMKELLDSQSK